MTEKLVNQEAIPEKFKQNGDLNVPALLQSYRELEKKIGSMVSVPKEDASDEERRSFYRAIGVPETVEAYQIQPKSDLLESDAEVNQRLFELGFTNKQAQAVYDLAAEKILPVIQDLARDYEADKQKQALINYFGGSDRWNEVSEQISTWAAGHVEPEILEALSTTYEGVLALYKMMQSGEPVLKHSAQEADEILDEEGLKRLMMSPKYWREQDPATLKKVSDGFKRLYPNKR